MHGTCCALHPPYMGLGEHPGQRGLPRLGDGKRDDLRLLARGIRIGQRRNVLVHKFVCRGTIEEKIDAMIRDKTALAGEILEGGTPKLLTEMGDRELLNLVKLDASTIGEE